jgi:hypothetical protein
MNRSQSFTVAGTCTAAVKRHFSGKIAIFEENHPVPRSRFVADIVAVLIGLLATYILIGFPHLHFTEPVALDGDHPFLLGMIKDSMNGIGVFNEHLGAPSHKNVLYFPLFDGSYKLLIWILSRFTSNVFLVVNLFYLAGITLMFSSSYWSLRTLNIKSYLASAASIAFVLSPYLARRAFTHDLLVMYYSVPMGATLALLLLQGDVVRKALSPFVICAVLLVGTSGLYYAFFSAMFLGLAMTARSFTERSFKPIFVCACIAVVLVLLLLFSAYSYHMWRWLIGGVGLVFPPKRFVAEQLYHGLLISTALHVYSDLGLFVSRFAEYKTLINAGQGMGALDGEGYLFEWPGAFLTTIILAAPIALFAFIGTRTPRWTLVAFCLAFITFGLVFAIRGGLGYAFNFLFIGAIRAQERILVFLTFYAIVIVCLGCESIQRRSYRIAVTAIAGCALLAGIYPVAGAYSAFQLLPRRQGQFLASKSKQGYRQSIIDVLAAKDVNGITMVLQLPVMQWPEAPPQGVMSGNEHNLPYIFDKIGNKTRWSYGLTAGQMPPFLAMFAVDAEIPAKAKAIGFDGILVEKTGYTPERAAGLVAALKENGACIKHEDEFRALLSICK